MADSEQEQNARIRRHQYDHIDPEGTKSTPMPSDDPHDAEPVIKTSDGKFKAPFEHLNLLGNVLMLDYDFIIKKDQEYNASWLTRGGVGAFMMLARKWDRLEPMVAKHGYDIFTMLDEHPDRIDDVEDLCRYLVLVRCEHLRRQQAGKPMRAG